MRRLTVAVLVATSIGCRGRTDPPELEDAAPDTVEPGFSPALIALLDSAATVLGAGDYEEADRIYLAAAGMDSTLAAPWFGLFMARRGMGRVAAADSALARARELVVNPIGPHSAGTRD